MGGLGLECYGSKCFNEGYEDQPSEVAAPSYEEEDYRESLERAENYMKMMEENITVFDWLYWKIVLENMQVLFQTAQRKLAITSWEITGCVAIGYGALFIFGILLKYFGPMRIKTCGLLTILCILGSTFITEGLDVAASVIIGITALIYLFLAKIRISTRTQQIIYRKDNSEESAIFLFVQFWYIGDRVLWINLTEGFVAVE